MEAALISVEDVSGILAFWFEELEPDQWFKKDEGLDNLIRSRFASVHHAAARCELWPWRATPYGRLAEIILLDQFSRNIFRDQPEAFATDPLALALAQEAVSVGADKALTPQEKAFLYMPFMHSESLEVHNVAMELFNDESLASHFAAEQKHRDILLQFGRYPHRNAILGRDTTEDEEAFLKLPGTSF
ncbi:DUF924 domain-containing protein [Alteromonas pelagimontana]|uniref:DUF924 domain-containing protein n=1 Tax=Alteromonas pelagimontana TaxID=1858656 RepID=A0A6M4M8I3_9ALTE|nr:DUF924 family protein [Alteromonas pelagimontana]QJR79531.1 DUF924 domain-containing protein [Alteromonas pelagimontana]